MKLRTFALLAALVVFGAACGSDDDGAAVRNVGEESSGSGSASGSASGSGSEHASGSASAPASGSASGSAVAEDCHVEDGVEATGDSTVVTAALDEYSIAADPDEVPAGLVTFESENVGAEPHELAVVRADDVDSLPTTHEGAVDLDAVGEDLIGEIEAFDAGETCEGTFELAAGDYVLLCNLVEEHGAHVAEGMHTTFTVTG